MPFLRIFNCKVMHLSKFYKKRLKTLSGIVSEGISTIQELDTEDVSIPTNYIKDSLNPKVWDGDKLKPEIRENLLKIASEYIKYLDLKITPERIMFLGSMANYNWNESSDFDLHIVYDFKKVSDDADFVKDFFDTKGSNWKGNHHITLKGYDVEVYVQEKEEENKSVGVYDLSKNDWINKPKKEDVKIDKELIKKKSASIATQIEKLEKLSNKDYNWDKIYKNAKILKDKIKKMRQAGLDESGEFSAENLAFKYLRNNGYLEKLGNISSKSFDKNLSMDENNISEAEQNIDERYLRTVIFKNKQRPQIIIIVKKTPDGKIVEIENEFNINFPFKVGQVLNMNHEVWACNNNYLVNEKDTCPEKKVFGIKQNDIPHGHELRKLFPSKFKNESKMKINENTERENNSKHRLIIKKSVDNLDENKIKLIKKFIIDCCTELNIDKPCCVYLTGERGGPITTTASYNPNNDYIWIYTKNRNMLGDNLRSLAHEIRHFKQKIDNELVENSGETGSKQENEANSFSGIMIRKFGKKYPEIYK
jgi:hypothetical protein